MLTSPRAPVPRPADAYRREPALSGSPPGPSNARARVLSRAIAIAGASLSALLAASSCVPTPFTFDETNGGAGGATTAQGNGGATSSASNATSSGTGSTPPACEAGFTCLNDVPPGWDGPGLVYVAEAGGALPACTYLGEPWTVYAKPNMEPHACETCTCSNPTATCSAPEIQCWFGNSQCGSMTGVTMQLTTASCASDATSPVLEDQLGSCKLIGDPVQASPGACVKGASAVVGGPDHAEDVAVCDAKTGGTCVDGAFSCVALPTDGARLCIGTPGGVDQCPEAWPDMLEVFEEIADKRDCSLCGCEPLRCTGGQYTVGDAAMCDVMGAATAVVDSGACTPVNNILDGAVASFKPVLGKPDPVTCTGGEPAGSVIPGGPVALCCKPLAGP